MGQMGAALVTGATKRIGLAIAERLVAAGYGVVLHASPRSQAQGETEAARLGAHLVTGDLADPEACARIVAEAAQKCGGFTLLVNNAALFEPDSPEKTDLVLWERQFAVNLRAPVLLAQHFVEQAPAGDAAIVNVIDQRVLRPTPLFFSYTLAKSALWTATQTMAQAFAERGIRVNAVGPGPVLPNAMDGDAGFSKEIEGVPLHRAVAPEDVAEAVLYLARARNVTGQLIAVDSGQHLSWRTPDVIA